MQNFDDLGINRLKVNVVSQQSTSDDWFGEDDGSDSNSEDEKTEEASPTGFFGKEEIPLNLRPVVTKSTPALAPLTPGRNGRRVLASNGGDSSGRSGGSTSANAPDRRRVVKINRSATYITDTSAKIRKTVVGKDFNGNVKASRIVSAVVDVLSRVYIRARHLALIVKWFKLGKCHKTRHFGTYRVELIVLLFSRVVDIHNFDLVMSMLVPYEMACVICRLGILNIFNPTKPEGPICLGERDKSYMILVNVWTNIYLLGCKFLTWCGIQICLGEMNDW